MANIVIECPACKKPVRAGTGFFAKKNIKCTCGYMINVNMERLAQDTCPHCGNEVVYDRTKKDSATCPVCHAKIHSGTEKVKINCPSCKIELTADKNASTYTCPQCKSLIDVQACVAKAKSSGKTSVVKWDMGMNDIFVYRHPVENFNIGSQLIVNEGQKAVFFRNGQGLDVFGPGRHVLETQKLPLMEELVKYMTDGDATFDSKVYFVRTNRLEVGWGIPNLRLRNPGMDFYVNIGFGGSCDLQVMDDNESVRKLVYMIIGSAPSSAHNGDRQKIAVGGEEAYTSKYMAEKFRDIITTRLSDKMANLITDSGINVIDIESKKVVISDIIREDMNRVFAEYGLEVPPMHFNVTDIRIHNSEEVERWIKQESDKVLKVRDEEVLKAEAQAAQGRILVQEQTEAQRRILRAQGAGEELKVKTDAEAQALRMAAAGQADSMKLKAEGEGESAKLRAQGQAEAIRLTGQAQAESYAAQAMAEAEEMKAKGYTYSQETSRQIGLEAMQNGLPGTGAGSGGSAAGGIGSALGDMIGLGVGLGAMGEVVGMTKGMMSPIMDSVKGSVASNDQSTPAEAPTTSNKVMAWNCSCGKSCITSRFCPECGSPKPEPKNTGAWDCSCGCTGITSKFCPDCGSKRPEEPSSWTCPDCGSKDITSKFCPNCGYKKG